MQLNPTPTARAMIATAAMGVLVAAFCHEPVAMLWMGSILMGVTVAHGVANLKVARARRQGFEMYLKEGVRRFNVVRGRHFTIEIVLRNRSTVAMRLRDFQVLASPEIMISAGLTEIHLGAQSSVEISLRGVAVRVGHSAVHGLTLRVVDSSGTFEAPLIFVSPVQVLVWPATLRMSSRASLGGRSQRRSDAERTGHSSGDSIELRELRAHQPGDAMRKIAWKASARRGILLVRDEELMERQSLWVILDASLELWAGVIGSAPLDNAIDQLASLSRKYIALGDRVGLGIMAARTLAWVPLDSGAIQLARLTNAFLKAAQLWDADRSGCDEDDVARVVLEHAVRIEPALGRQTASAGIERVLQGAARILKQFELEVPDVYAKTPRERLLRQYATVFGLTSPRKLEPERTLTDEQLLSAIERCVKDRPTRILVCSVEPSTRLLDGIALLRRRLLHHHIKLSWLCVDVSAGLPRVSTPAQQTVNDAIQWRIDAANLQLRGKLRRLGISIEQLPKPQVNRPGVGVI